MMTTSLVPQSAEQILAVVSVVLLLFALTVDSPAPVEIIRGLASEFLDHQSPKDRNKYTAIGTGDDIVSKGIVSEAYAQELLDMYHFPKPPNQDS
jgi:hypothetical protein